MSFLSKLQNGDDHSETCHQVSLEKLSFCACHSKNNTLHIETNVLSSKKIMMLRSFEQKLVPITNSYLLLCLCKATFLSTNMKLL